MNNFAVILGTAFVASTNAINHQGPGLAQVAARQDGSEAVYEEVYTEEAAAVEEAPVEEAAVEEPVEEVAVEEAPVDPIEEVIEEPVEEVAVEEAPVEEAAVEEAPVEEAAVEEAPVEETDVEQPVEEVPVEEPVEEVAVEEAPVEEAAVEEAPVEESAVEEAPIEEEVASTEESVESASLVVDDDSKAVGDDVPLENATAEQTEYVATLAESVMETLMTSDMEGLNIISLVYSDETIEAASALMAQESIVAAAGFYDELPGVCESGQECRDTIGATTNANVQSEWRIAFDNIRLELENAVLRSGVHIESGYNEAVMCDPGCGPDCSEVEIELANAYDEMVRIMGEIRALEEEQAIALETINHIEDMCPAFAGMSDEEIAIYADEQMETYADAI